MVCTQTKKITSGKGYTMEVKSANEEDDGNSRLCAEHNGDGRLPARPGACARH